MTGIVRQSDQYAAFDNTPRPERIASEAPPEIIREFTRGRTVGAGQNNPRGIRHHFAVNTHGMDPDSHAYAEESYGGPYDPGGEWVGDEDGHRRPRRDWDPNTGYQPDEGDERASELVGEDDDSGYNWGPEPGFDPGSEPGPHPDFSGDAPHPFGTPIYNPRSGSRLGFNKAADDGGGGGDFGGDGGLSSLGGEGPIGNNMFTYMFLQKHPEMLSQILGT